MIINFVLLATVAVLIATGVYLFLDRAMTKMLMGALLMGNGINLLILIAGNPGDPPIWGRGSGAGGETADPLPQAFILTAIVITMGLAAFLLALAYRQHRYRVGDQVQDDREDQFVAMRRPDDPSAAPDHDRSDDPTTGRPTEAGDKFGPDSFEKPVEEDDSGDD
ncbi:Na(+)/H(+) antiporter subunit C [Corynebacterium hansenii]|uniref:Na(+)/H(+) antiporter subunit C n=1 Tax=Corynebacterium hansenii TaxID=394964 RepID=A0ABV7ZQE7_9CORY|nr:Na(+)/H(+) antiporter subunit C [Corynebacterium hansenii]WJZ01088.1 Na(+)/H(+) antiporter subunit C [Corynebacterium hansenii]